jgi:hypothetical protein
MKRSIINISGANYFFSFIIFCAPSLCHAESWLLMHISVDNKNKNEMYLDKDSLRFDGKLVYINSKMVFDDMTTYSAEIFNCDERESKKESIILEINGKNENIPIKRNVWSYVEPGKPFAKLYDYACNQRKINEENLEKKKNSEKKLSEFLTIESNNIADENGYFFLNIKTERNIKNILINNTDYGSRSIGSFQIKIYAKIEQETVFTVVATDITGNTDTKKITVNRPVVESRAKFTPLNPAQVKKQPERDAVAIIIGIADYKNLPRADFANDDARVFYDYASRALGIKPENIKLLVDANADEVAIYQAFKTWLPSRVRSTTDVYVYYSGHGLPTEDGKGLYLLPQRAHRDLIEKTAISQQEISGFIQAARPRSVTIFLDSCYSGLARSGETLLASARPVVLKSDKKLFPDNFTVITASQADQISNSSPDLKHGIFSYYLMRGMEGEADADKDGRITAGEMHRYLSEQVVRQAGMMNRRQEPQLVGDANRVLVGY